MSKKYQIVKEELMQEASAPCPQSYLAIPAYPTEEEVRKISKRHMAEIRRECQALIAVNDVFCEATGKQIPHYTLISDVRKCVEKFGLEETLAAVREGAKSYLPETLLAKLGGICWWKAHPEENHLRHLRNIFKQCFPDIDLEQADELIREGYDAGQEDFWEKAKKLAYHPYFKGKSWNDFLDEFEVLLGEYTEAK